MLKSDGGLSRRRQHFYAVKWSNINSVEVKVELKPNEETHISAENKENT